MNTPDETITSGWSAEISGRESWRDLGGTFPNWWEAGMALIDDEIGNRKIEWTEPSVRDQVTDDIFVPDDQQIDVGIFRDPEPPERAIDADDIIHLMRDDWHEDYELEFAEDWLSSVTKDQKDELTFMLRGVIREWLERHNINPTWKVVGKRWTVTAGQIRAKAREMRSK